MKTKIAAAALLAALGVATTAFGQVTHGRGPISQTGTPLSHHRVRSVTPVIADQAPPIIVYPEGYTPPASDLRAVQTLYDYTAGGLAYSYSPNTGGSGVGTAFNGGLEAVQFGPAWAAGTQLTQINCGVHKVAAGTQSFKFFVRIWENVNAGAAPGTPVQTVQLGPDLFYNQAFNVTGNFTVGFQLALPAGITPTDNNVGIEIRLVNASVTTTADAANPANTNPNMATDCMGLNGATAFPPAMPSIGAPYPSDGIGHFWVDVNDAGTVPPAVHDGSYAPEEDLDDTDGAMWANSYLRVLGDVPGIVAPPNNQCGSATVVTMPGSAPSATSVNGTTAGAVTNAPVPPACGVGNPADQRGVWYSFAGRGRVTTASTCGSGAFDSVVRVYSGTCAAPVCVAGIDDDGTVGCPGNFGASTVRFNAAVGTTYLIYVRPFDGLNAGTFTLSVTEGDAIGATNCTLNANGATDITSQNPTCGVPSSPFGSCAAGILATDCTTYFDSLAAGIDPGTNGQVRGVDEFLYTVPATATSLDIQLSSESPMFALVLLSGDPADPCNNILVGSPGEFNTVPCATFTQHIAPVNPGDVYIVGVAPASWDATTCGAQGTHYRLTFHSDACVPTGPDCFSRLVNGVPPQNAGHYTRGAANGVSDDTECIGDWDRNGVLEPADVASYVSSWFYSAQNPGNLDADIDCSNDVVPADVAVFVTQWFDGLSHLHGCP